MGETKKQRSPLTTLCYIEKDDSYLMLHRIKKKQDVNEGKWIGVGGHFEENESPENCLLREVKEETGLTLTSWRFRGIVTFIAKGWPTEYMCLYTADGFEGTLRECDEGELAWVAKKAIIRSLGFGILWHRWQSSRVQTLAYCLSWLIATLSPSAGNICMPTILVTFRKW